MFVLRSDKYGRYDTVWDGYYIGETYTFQGEKYAVCDRDINKAKRYTSLKRAERAAECLFNRIVNYVFEVEEIKE